MPAMSWTLVVLAVSVALFGALLGLIEAGRRIGARAAGRDRDGTRIGAGIVEGAVFGLLGLMLAFTFSGAAARFDTRRLQIVDETNAIGTAYLRVDVLPAAAQPSLRDTFRRYVDSRLAAYRALPDMEAVEAELARTAALQLEIWRAAVAACREPGVPASTPLVVLPALNAMFDIVTTRTIAARTHPPAVTFGMLIGLTLISGLLVGHGMAGVPRSWLHMIGFALVMAVAMYVILDLEFPRHGLIRIDDFDRALAELRGSMK